MRILGTFLYSFNTFFIVFKRQQTIGSRTPEVEVFLITFRYTTVGTTPLDEGLALSERPLSDNTQHSQKTDNRTPGGI